MRFFLAGLNHKTAPVEVREKVAFDEASLANALADLRKQPGMHEGIILSTCNRVEVAVTAEDGADAEGAVENFISASRSIDRSWVTPYLYRHDGEDAIRHVFRVASSLDSMVVGEPQILGQLKSAYAVAKECGWVTVYDEAAIVQDRPLHIKMDDQNRLHCEDGPAILYADGFDVYSWHGVRVPEEWIKDKKSLTAKTAITWENTEQRRAACEILGWINVLKELNSRVIDEDADEQVGTLLEVEIPDIGTERFLKVTCGTGRQFAIPVPPDVETALAANAWTFNIEPDVLRMLEVRT